MFDGSSSKGQRSAEEISLAREAETAPQRAATNTGAKANIAMVKGDWQAKRSQRVATSIILKRATRKEVRFKSKQARGDLSTGSTVLEQSAAKTPASSRGAAQIRSALRFFERAADDGAQTAQSCGRPAIKASA